MYTLTAFTMHCQTLIFIVSIIIAPFMVFRGKIYGDTLNNVRSEDYSYTL